MSKEWANGPGKGASPSWPVGVGGKGNEGVAGLVRQLPGAIGYVELIYAVQNKMAYGSVKNASGNFVKADFDTVTEAAAAAAKNIPDDFRVSITNAAGKNAYPISTFTWLLIPSHIPDAAKAKTIKAFLQWMLADGQQYAAGLSYASLPKEVIAKEVKQIAKIQ